MIPGSASAEFFGAAGAAAGGGAYEISRSLRFNPSDSAYCGRVFSTNGTDRKRLTLSYWIKLCDTSAVRTVISGYNGSSTEAAYWQFNSGGAFSMSLGGASSFGITTTQVFRDPSAWYHFVISIDTTVASPSSDRIKLYVNGTQVTTFSSSTYPTQNYEVNLLNAGTQTNIGVAWNTSYGGYMNGYLADCYLIDGQALDPSSFTTTDLTTGQLIPKAYTGSYGTNGFQLKFADNSSNTATTLGKDTSGNSNNWTPNNLSVTAGAGNDSLVDTPTSFGTDTGVGGEVRGNYATLNPLKNSATLQNGNLDASNTASSWQSVTSTIYVSSGKWYAEFTNTRWGDTIHVGIASKNWNASAGNSIGYTIDSYAFRSNVAETQSLKINNSTTSSYGARYVVNDVVGIALDLDAGTLTFYKNGVSQGQAYSGISGEYGFAASFYNGDGIFNFGQRAFAYTAPSGFKALVDTNLPAVDPAVAKPNTVMDVALWTGNATARTISGFNFSPDLVWIKNRSTAQSHTLYDTIRGATKALVSNTTDSELTLTNFLTAFTSDGFSIGTDNNPNGSGNGIVGWCWDAGTSTVTNTAGSITSQVRANPSSGFSIITWTASGSSTQTVGHGLGVAPALIITKSRTDGTTYNDWMVYHSSLAALNNLRLNTANAAATFPTFGCLGAPTSTVITLTAGSSGNFNVNSGNMVAYAFAPVSGYSSFGSYTGNGSADGPFVYTGFRSRWVLIKRTSATGDWWIYDTARNTYNVMGSILYPNISDAEFVDTSVFGQDILSNGFKVRNSNATVNGNGQTYIYFAVAENPFQYARAR